MQLSLSTVQHTPELLELMGLGECNAANAAGTGLFHLDCGYLVRVTTIVRQVREPNGGSRHHICYKIDCPHCT